MNPPTHTHRIAQRTHTHTHCLSHVHTHSHTHTLTHEHTHTLTHALSLSLSLALLSHTHSLSPSLSLSHTHTHTHLHVDEVHGDAIVNQVLVVGRIPVAATQVTWSHRNHNTSHVVTPEPPCTKHHIGCSLSADYTSNCCETPFRVFKFCFDIRGELRNLEELKN